MHDSQVSLRRGVLDATGHAHKGDDINYRLMFDHLSFLVGELIEGDVHRKAAARELTKKLIGRGRCLLNAEAIEARSRAPAANEARYTCTNCGEVTQLKADQVCYLCGTKLGGCDE